MNFAPNPQSCYSAGPSDGRATARDHQRRDECRWKDRAPGRQRRSIEQRRRSPSRASPSSGRRCDPRRGRYSSEGRSEADREIGIREGAESPTSDLGLRWQDSGFCPRFGRKRPDVDRLAARDVKTILVEGGSTVIWSFLRKGLADELKVFVSSRVLGGQAAPTLAGGQGVTSLDAAPRLRLDRIERLGDGALLEYAVVR